MRLLREYIRELLSEGAKGVADLPPQAYVSVSYTHLRAHET